MNAFYNSNDFQAFVNIIFYLKFAFYQAILQIFPLILALDRIYVKMGYIFIFGSPQHIFKHTIHDNTNICLSLKWFFEPQAAGFPLIGEDALQWRHLLSRYFNTPPTPLRHYFKLTRWQHLNTQHRYLCIFSERKIHVSNKMLTVKKCVLCAAF